MNIAYFGGFQFPTTDSDTDRKFEYLKNHKVLSQEGLIFPVNMNYYTNIEMSVQNTGELLRYRNRKKRSEANYAETLLVGISLGGFFAYYYAKLFSVPALIINPCYAPTKMLQKHLNHFVGTSEAGYSIFSEQDLEEYAVFEDALPNLTHNFPDTLTIVVNNNDEIIRFDTENDILNLRKIMPEGELIQYPTGGHRATNFPAIVDDVLVPLYTDVRNYKRNLFS